MIRPPPRSTPTDTLFPYTTLFLSVRGGISRGLDCAQVPPCDRPREPRFPVVHPMKQRIHYVPANDGVRLAWRSEEHTSELQPLMRISYAVFCLTQPSTDPMFHLSQLPTAANATTPCHKHAVQ